MRVTVQKRWEDENYRERQKAAYKAAMTPEECAAKSQRVTKLWADPVYRERAVAARKGKTYAKGFKCNPEQVENRKRAGRISNMRRNYGGDWKKEYVSRYPEHTGDVDGE